MEETIEAQESSIVMQHSRIRYSVLTARLLGRVEGGCIEVAGTYLLNSPNRGLVEAFD